MKIIRILTVLSIALVAFSSCRKEKTYETSFTGQVTEFGTNTPVPNALIHLEKCGGEGLSGGYCNVVETYQTDENGYYEIEIMNTENALYDLLIEAEGYYKWDDPYAYDAGRQEQIDPVLDPHAWLKLNIKNTNPANEQDKIRFGWEYGQSGWEEFEGNDINETLIWKGFGNIEGNLIWKVTKNNEKIEYREPIVVSAHDTLVYTIEY